MAPRKTSAASKKAAAAVTEKTKTTTTSTSNKRTSSSGGPAANAKRSRTSAEKPAKATKPAAAPAPAKPAPAKRAHRVPARSRTLAQKKVQPTTPAAPPSPPAVINKAPTERFELWSFGSGSTGELGKGPKRNVLLSPRPVDSLADAGHVVQVAPGGMHVAALTSNGRVFTWGQNDTKNLGRDTTWDPEFKDQDDADAESLNPLESTPAPIPEDFFPKGTKITQLAASDSATFALTETGQVYGWGVFRVCCRWVSLTILSRKPHPNELNNRTKTESGVSTAKLTAALSPNAFILLNSKTSFPFTALQTLHMLSTKMALSSPGENLTTSLVVISRTQADRRKTRPRLTISA